MRRIERKRRLDALRPGARVRSKYRAPWTGVVLEPPDRDGVVLVQITHDRTGRPTRAETKRLDWLLLEVIDG